MPALNVPKRARLYRAIGLSLAGLVLVAAGIHVAANVWLNRYVRPKVEKAASVHLPGTSLRLGALRYEFWRNRLHCASLDLSMPSGEPARTGSVSLMGVGWTGLMAGKPNPWQLLRHAQIDVTNLSAGWPAGEYRVQCGQLRISVPDSEFTVQTLTLQPSVSDEAFFAADPFRRVRYRLAVASCTVRGVGFAELFDGQAYRAESVELKAPMFESFVDREKPRRPSTGMPPMAHEVLASIKRPFRIGRFTIIDGSVRTMGRRFAGAEPGVLTFSAVSMTANEVANAAAGGRMIGILAEGRLVDAGKMTVQMSVPVAPASLAFHYSGKLGAMDLTRLNAYLSGMGGFEIKSGHADGASFDVAVTDGRAHGAFKGAYQGLQVTVLGRETGSEKGVTERVATLLANQIKVRHENKPDKAGVIKEGKIDYARLPEETFLQFAWNALRAGITDLITL